MSNFRVEEIRIGLRPALDETGTVGGKRLETTLDSASLTRRSMPTNLRRRCEFHLLPEDGTASPSATPELSLGGPRWDTLGAVPGCWHRNLNIIAVAFFHRHHLACRERTASFFCAREARCSGHENSAPLSHCVGSATTTRGLTFLPDAAKTGSKCVTRGSSSDDISPTSFWLANNTLLFADLNLGKS